MISQYIEDLVGVGMTEAQIATAVGRSQPSINRMRHGKQRCDFDTGTKLTELHRQKCPPPQPDRGRAAA